MEIVIFFLWLLINFLNKRAKRKWFPGLKRLKTLWLNSRGQGTQWWGRSNSAWGCRQRSVKLTPVKEVRSDFIQESLLHDKELTSTSTCADMTGYLKGRMGEGKRRDVGCSILSNAFSASTEMTIWFLSCILLTGVSQWLIFIWWTSWHPRDESHLIVVWFF